MNAPEFVVCLNNEGYTASLEIGKLCQTVPDDDAEAMGGLRVTDEDAEDYFYDAAMFCRLQVPPVVADALLAARQK
jgi:hypothetical protein